MFSHGLAIEKFPVWGYYKEYCCVHSVIPYITLNIYLVTSVISLFSVSVVLSYNHPVLVQFSSVAQSCLTLCDPMNNSTPGLPVHHQLPDFTQTHVHRVGDAIQPSHPRSSPSSPAPNPSKHQRLFQWVNSSHEMYWNFSSKALVITIFPIPVKSLRYCTIPPISILPQFSRDKSLCQCNCMPVVIYQYSTFH